MCGYISMQREFKCAPVYIKIDVGDSRFSCFRVLLRHSKWSKNWLVKCANPFLFFALSMNIFAAGGLLRVIRISCFVLDRARQRQNIISSKRWVTLEQNKGGIHSAMARKRGTPISIPICPLFLYAVHLCWSLPCLISLSNFLWRQVLWIQLRSYIQPNIANHLIGAVVYYLFCLNFNGGMHSWLDLGTLSIHRKDLRRGPLPFTFIMNIISRICLNLLRELSVRWKQETSSN